MLDPLRGAAALAVCMFHFCATGDLLAPSDPVRRISSLGYLGVDAFFVISGFVIPYSLSLRSYRMRDSIGFLVRRLKRLEPPYFACIALVVLLNVLASRILGTQRHPLPGVGQLLAHIAYLNAVLDYGWLNPVFWTLAIEFQFYIFVAIAFPVLNQRHFLPIAVVLSVVSIAGIAGRSYPALLLNWLPLFAMGMAAFQFVVGRLRLSEFSGVYAVVSVIAYCVLGELPTLVGVFTGLCIALCGCRGIPKVLAPLAMAGTISYSLYLLHVPLGMRVVSLACRLPESLWYRYPAVLIASSVTVVGAYWFWKLVELPSYRWAKETRRLATVASGARQQTHDEDEPVLRESLPCCAEIGNR
jgi:peptidoglycan/LPS O-acetylase OafA/YrhL